MFFRNVIFRKYVDVHLSIDSRLRILGGKNSRNSKKTSTICVFQKNSGMLRPIRFWSWRNFLKKTSAEIGNPTNPGAAEKIQRFEGSMGLGKMMQLTSGTLSLETRLNHHGVLTVWSARNLKLSRWMVGWLKNGFGQSWIFFCVLVRFTV